MLFDVCRQIKEQVLAAIHNKQHTISIELSARARHRALQHLAFVGEHKCVLKHTACQHTTFLPFLLCFMFVSVLVEPQPAVVLSGTAVGAQLT